MSLYAIGDLHLSFGTNKPMNIFGENWDNYEEVLKKNWQENVKEEDTVILLGDFSWATYLEETEKDFYYLNSLPGTKIMLKGNHDYWWATVNKMKKFLQEKQIGNIEFLYNNSYLYKDYIIAGTRGWSNQDGEEDRKVKKREKIRLELSIQDGIKKYGKDKKIIVCTHYPPFGEKIEETDLLGTMKNYSVEKCLYGHLHGIAHNDAIQGKIDGIEFLLLSSDFTNFKLTKILD